jgi:hypothetical protein
LYFKIQKDIETKLISLGDSVEFSIEKNNYKSTEKFDEEGFSKIYEEVFDDNLLFQLRGKNIELD